MDGSCCGLFQYVLFEPWGADSVRRVPKLRFVGAFAKFAESGSQCLIHMTFRRQHWLRERAFILRYPHVVSVNTGMTRLVALH